MAGCLCGKPTCHPKLAQPKGFHPNLKTTWAASPKRQATPTAYASVRQGCSPARYVTVCANRARVNRPNSQPVTPGELPSATHNPPNTKQRDVFQVIGPCPLRPGDLRQFPGLHPAPEERRIFTMSERPPPNPPKTLVAGNCKHLQAQHQHAACVDSQQVIHRGPH